MFDCVTCLTGVIQPNWCLHGATTGNMIGYFMGLRWRICQSARLSPMPTWVQFPLGTTYDSYVKTVSQRSVVNAQW